MGGKNQCEIEGRGVQGEANSKTKIKRRSIFHIEILGARIYSRQQNNNKQSQYWVPEFKYNTHVVVVPYQQLS